MVDPETPDTGTMVAGEESHDAPPPDGHHDDQPHPHHEGDEDKKETPAVDDGVAAAEGRKHGEHWFCEAGDPGFEVAAKHAITSAEAETKLYDPLRGKLIDALLVEIVVTCSRPHHGTSIWGAFWAIRPILASVCFCIVYVGQYYLISVVVQNIIAPAKIVVDTQIKSGDLRDFLRHYNEEDWMKDNKEKFFAQGTVSEHIWKMGPIKNGMDFLTLSRDESETCVRSCTTYQEHRR